MIDEEHIITLDASDAVVDHTCRCCGIEIVDHEGYILQPYFLATIFCACLYLWLHFAYG